MLKSIRRITVATVLAVFGAASAQAATVNFTISSATVAITDVSAPLDGNSVIQSLLPALPTNLSANSSAEQTLPLFNFSFPSGRSNVDQTADTYNLLATIVLDITGDAFGSITYNVAGTISNWFSTNGGVLTNGQITWQNPIPNITTPLLNISLTNTNLFTNSRPSGVTTSLSYLANEVSVVPLPAGILLLGTALLGLFGLSRRRKLAAA